MRAVDAAVKILELEGATQAFGLPGAAINPFYDAMRSHGGIKHILARHVESASHMAKGYTRDREHRDLRKLLGEFRVPVVVEVILERVTNISMGTEIDALTEFEELAVRGEDAPTAVILLD